jgi:hypothetical protein
MATTFTSNTLLSSYDDDYNKNDNYHQILFNNGRALQARELTQLQSLVYAELSRMGHNVFKDGAAITSPAMACNDDYDYVQIASTNSGGDFADIPLGTVFRNPSTGLTARVLEVKPIDNDMFTLDTLYVQYINNNQADVSSVSNTFGDNETLFDQSGNGYELVTHTPNSTGKGVRFDVGEGTFFVLGRFVHSNDQHIILSANTNAVDAVVGFKVIQEVVTVNDTSALYDNSGGIINRASPGADRYRIRLELTTKDRVTSDDTFVFLANVENSTIVETVQENDAYNQIEELMALRTDEESGDYIVEPFTIHFEDVVSNDSSLELIISKGTAYVNGYRAENPSPIRLTVPRPQETDLVENDVVPIVYGNYFIAASASARGLPSLDYSTVNISSSATDPSGNVIGTCRIRAVEKDGPNLRVYVFDVQINDGESLATARTIGTGTSDRFVLDLQGTNARLYQTIDNDLLMPTSRPRAKAFSDIVLTVQKFTSDNSNSSGEIDISSVLVGSESFTDGSSWVVVGPSGVVSPTVNISTGVISGLSNVTAYDILYYVQKTGTVKSKTLSSATTATLTKATATDPVNGNSYVYYDFGVPDVYSIDSVRADDANGNNLLPRFILDDGQRDNFYADSRLILQQGDSAPTSLYVKYRHFTRGATGDFYAPSSYNNAVGYSDIPTHVIQTGEEVKLINYLDFRPDKNAGTFSNIHFLPRNATNVTADITYYLPRADKLLIDEDGTIQLLMGQQDENPQFKATPDNTLELYKIVMGANTLDENDVQITPIEHKGYTMKDIAGLEAKLDRLEEYTTSKFLELEQKINTLLDSQGDVRPSIGIVVDNVDDQTGSEVANPDYRASLDPESRLIRPMADENNIRLIVDNSLSQNIRKKGDNIYLDYSEVTWKSHDLASEFVNVNPFGLTDNVGTLKLSPSSDEWKDAFEKAEYALTGSNKISQDQALLWNNWMWNWAGRDVSDLHLAGAIASVKGTNPRAVLKRKQLKKLDKFLSNSSFIVTETSTGRHVNRVLSSESIRKLTNGKYIDLALIPWMRSRKVYFQAKGLTPNTKFTPFFDGQNVSDWCREESTFVRWADRTDDIGNKYTSSDISSHPDGNSELTSDENGEIIGSFFIPNIAPEYEIVRYVKGKKIKTKYVRFRSGIREFKLLDIDRNDWSDAGSKCFAYYSAIGQVDKSWQGFLSLRGWQWVAPWSYIQTRLPFTPKELQTALDNITETNVGILDPKLAGKFGPLTSPLSAAALQGLDATGEMSQVLSDYIDVNQNVFGGTNTNVLSLPQNPLAQTFEVTNQFGLTLTKVDLFFRKKDSGNIPISIHIRPVVGGKPSQTTIVPDSHVYLNPSEVVAIGTDPQLSVIQSRPTSFEFDEPIYLQPNTTYAVVVSTQSTEYELFSSTVGQSVYGSTSRYVTNQPTNGTLFLPQNAATWIGSKDRDIMFTLHRASFDIGGGSLVLKNADLPVKLLKGNSIRTNDGSSKVYVQHMCHGLQPGDIAQLDSCSDANGILSSQLNTTHTVDSADLYGYTVTTAGTATSSGFGGGNRILSQGNTVFSVVNPTIDVSIPKNTSIDASAKFTTGRFISGTATRYQQPEQYRKISLNQNVDFDLPRAIYSKSTETAQGLSSSAIIKLDLKTASDYVSPVIDLQRASLVLVGYCVDDPEVTPYVYPVEETQPYGGKTGFTHITTPTVLRETAVGVDARFDVNLPDGSDIQFYYRTGAADENLKDKPWNPYPIKENIPRDNSGEFYTARFLVGGEGGRMDPFQQSQFKIACPSKDRPPMLSSFSYNFLSV